MKRVDIGGSLFRRMRVLRDHEVGDNVCKAGGRQRGEERELKLKQSVSFECPYGHILEVFTSHSGHVGTFGWEVGLTA